MAEENDTPIEKVEAPELTPVEQRAMNEGWVPQDQWNGDPDQWRPAKEFVDRGELFKKIEEQKRELKNMRAAIDDLGKHHAEVKKIAYKEALAALRAQKKDALETGDAEAVVALDDKIAETREAQRAAEVVKPVEQVSNEPHPAMVAWETRNAWYKSDRAMKGAADAIAQEMLERGFRDPVAILTEVDKRMRSEFPNKFENPNRSRAGAVEGSTTKASRKDEDFSMSDAEKRIMQRIVGTGALTKEQYIKEYKARQGG